MMNIQITSATVVRNPQGPDVVYFKTVLPDGCWPYRGTAQLRLDLAADSAEQYLGEHFPELPYEVVGTFKNSEGATP